MKLKGVSVYQTVSYNKKNHTFFADNKDLGLAGVEMTYLPEMQAVRITLPGKDDILIFVTNIAYAIPADTTVPNVTENRAKLKDINSGAKVK